MTFIGKAWGKAQAVYFYTRLYVHGLLGLPAQTCKERKLFKAIFDQFAGKKIKMFEWGSGFSTIYYAKYLKDRGISFEWHTIDNNRSWHEKIATMVKNKGLGDSVSLYVKEFLPFWQKPDWKIIPPPKGVFAPKGQNEIDYVNYPKTLNTKFDIIMIDARFRRRCLSVSKEVLASGGIVILHDAQKPHYRVGEEIFPHRRLINSGTWFPFQKDPNQVWVGVAENKSLIESLKSF
jgi:predicted O-methyltransferase YrrM